MAADRIRSTARRQVSTTWACGISTTALSEEDTPVGIRVFAAALVMT
jgi:hypothetical protein